jgi:hypothetical protein
MVYVWVVLQFNKVIINLSHSDEKACVSSRITNKAILSINSFGNTIL